MQSNEPSLISIAPRLTQDTKSVVANTVPILIRRRSRKGEMKFIGQNKQVGEDRGWDGYMIRAEDLCNKILRTLGEARLCCGNYNRRIRIAVKRAWQYVQNDIVLCRWVLTAKRIVP